MIPRLAGACAVLLLSGIAAVCAQDAARYQFPDNLDVPFVPTNQPAVEAMLRIAGVGPNDSVIDLGSGDGRIAITAARLFGARALGVDLDPRRVREAEENRRALPPAVAERVSFRQQNIFDTPLADATVVTMYLLPGVNLQLRPRLLELKPGTRIVSHDFHMGDWHADLTANIRGSGSTLYFWVVPARAAGRWEIAIAGPQGPRRVDAVIRQSFQEITVALSERGKTVNAFDSRLDGDRLSFLWVDDSDYTRRWRFEGRLAGDRFEGQLRGEGASPREPAAVTARRTGD